ncbi:MAG: DegT/DnrJ/EryC1/StrS family aminotransferase [Bacteroidales bacterium]|nr:DegT/DnrJ/EryC1/StrS family aminotransferase [Candidatus Cacconaster merdequi]
MSEKIQMVDLKGQYLKIKDEVDDAIRSVIDSTSFINGPSVKQFADNLSEYMGGCHVITCANGTDALQIALMSLDLKPGDEVIVPAFTYVASAEVIGLLGLTPVMVDVDFGTFNVTVDNLRKALSPKSRAVIPVHLFGQSCDMEPILSFAEENHLFVIEDNAQAIGAEYTFSDGHKAKTGTMGTIGCTSFFPSKNLGCYGDGGAIFTNDDILAGKLRMIANHGQRIKYHHSVIGCNSRLDSIQAAVLDIKLKHLDEYCRARYEAASYYSAKLREFDPCCKFFETPVELEASTHVYHQYTLKIKDGRRDALKAFLADEGVPSMIYYPLPLQEQEAFKSITRSAESLEISHKVAYSVLSLPIHTEMTQEIQDKVLDAIRKFFANC